MISNLKKYVWKWSSNGVNNSIEHVFSLHDFQRLVEIERCRVNRNGGTFVVVVFRLEKIELPAKLLTKLVQGIYQRSRMSDQMGWYDDNHLGVILPETSQTGAQKFIEDLYRSNSNSMPMPQFDFYVYPSSD